jgi:hypothetical protein
MKRERSLIRLSAWLRDDGKAAYSKEGEPHLQDVALTGHQLRQQLAGNLLHDPRAVDKFFADLTTIGSAEAWVVGPRTVSIPSLFTPTPRV